VQPALMGPLDEAELKRLDGTVAVARERGMKLMLDLHNFGGCAKAVLGTPELPDEAFADVWRKLAAHFANEPAVFAYSIMNEPVGAKDRWPAAAQAAIDAIRTVDTNHTLSVCGGGFSGAHSWKKASNGFPLRDPASNIVYEAHQYFDRDNSGTYKQGYDGSGANPMTGVERLKPFVAWLKENNARGFLGEFGVPYDDPRWLEVLDNFIAELKANHIGGTYWAAGPRWGKYPMSVEPQKGRDRSQMEVLSLYAGDRMKPKDAKTSYADADAKMKASGQKMVFNFRFHDEAYHFSNKETEYASEVVTEGGQDTRKISFKHAGSPAYAGIGLFFGALKCDTFSSFVLAVRAEKPCSLDVKAHAPDKTTCTAHFKIGTEWQQLVIPFDQLKGDKGGFDAIRVLEKIEFQPSPDTAGNSLFLGEFKLAP
jgi:endoglucanase